VVRRITGGGAIYFDEGQLGWELVFDRATLGIASLADLARSICEAVAAGLSRLGVDARYRPRNDIEVGGRKISGTGGFFDENTLFYQGTVLVDMNPADMIAALRIPEAKLAKRALDSAAQRVVTLKELLGAAPPIETIQGALLEGFAQRLGIAPRSGAITAAEEALAARYHDEEIGTDAFVAEIDDPGVGEGALEGSHTGAGGTVTAYVRLEGPGRDRVREVLITGDFFVTPPRVVFDLEAALRSVPVAQIGAALERFFAQAKVGLLTVSPADFRAAIDSAIAAAR
jgi:lipoate-protein ligase A